MANPLKDRQFSYCLTGLGIFSQKNFLLRYAAAIQAQRACVERLDVVYKERKKKINDFEHCISSDEDVWHKAGLEIDKLKKEIDFCTARLIQMMPTVDFKHDSEYFADLQRIYNAQARWLKLKSGRTLAQEKRKGAGGLSDGLIEKYEKLEKQREELKHLQEHLTSARDRLSELENGFETALQAAIQQGSGSVRGDESFGSKMSTDFRL